MSGFKLDRGRFYEFLNSRMIRLEMVRRAEIGKLWAEGVASVEAYDPGDKPPHYKDSFGVRSGTNGGIHRDRAYASLFNTDEAALFLELGTNKTERLRILGRSLDMMKKG